MLLFGKELVSIMDYFIADTHFNDGNIIKYENRPFSSVSEMNEILVYNWNSVVTSQDRVFLVGDVLSAEWDEKLVELIQSLNGRKYLIRGNHDVEADSFYERCGFLKVYDYPIVLENFWIVSHEPLYMNNNMPYVNIYGHIHGNDMYKDYSGHSYCVSAERINFTPVSFDDIKTAVMSALEAQDKKI